MNCREVRRRLAALLDGEEGDRTAAGLERHLEACSDCRRRRRELAAARDRFRRLAPERSRLRAADVLARVAAEAEAGQGAARRTGGRPHPSPVTRRPVRRWLPLAAAVALAAVALWREAPRERAAPWGRGAADARREAAAEASAPLPALECGPAGAAGEECPRLACLDASECGAGDEPPWPPVQL